MTLMQSPLVSVVVTSHTQDRFESLTSLLDSLTLQTYRNVEVVFVLEDSLELAKRVEAYANQRGVRNLTVVMNPGSPGLSASRNVGVQHSRGDILAFIDDDAVAFPNWAECIVRAFAEAPEVIGITGPAFPDWVGGAVPWFPEEFYWLLSCPTPGWTGFTKPTPIRQAWGVNMAFRREAFTAARFSEAFSGGERTGADDGDFSMQVRRNTGKPILFHPSVCVSHKVDARRLATSFIWKKAFRDSYAKVRLKSLYAGGKDGRYDTGLERALLRRIVFRFLPALLRNLRHDPQGSWNQFRLATVALSSAGAGYMVGTLFSLVRSKGTRSSPSGSSDG